MGGKEPVEPFADRARLALVDRLPETIVVLDASARIRWLNDTGIEMLGYRFADIAGTSVFDLIHPDDVGYMLSSWEKRSRHPEQPGLIVQARVQRADGTWWASEVIGVSLLEDPEVRGMVITARDLSRQSALAESPARMRSMVDRTTDMLFLLSADGRFVYANRRLTALLGHDSDRVVGSSWTDLVAVDDVPGALSWFQRLVSDGDAATSRLQLRLVGPGGRSLAADLHGTNQLADPLIDGVIVAARDVEEEIAMRRALEVRNERLSHAVTHDALTGLRSRAAFVEAVEHALADRRVPDVDGVGSNEVVVLFCDLDGFKAVNDSYGHAFGDKVLQEVAARLRHTARDGDVVARYGGDEFIVLLGSSESPARVAALVARITGALAAPISIDGVTARVGVSIGVSRTGAGTAGVDALLSEADASMYARKRSRRQTDAASDGL
ncbi:MAG: diguanylate cyclase [Aquihabitans sp.]